MALYHFSVKQVSRGKGQTVVNSAAYIWQFMRENLRMRMNQIIRIFMYLLQSVLLQKMGAGGTSRNGNMFWMKTETG